MLPIQCEILLKLVLQEISNEDAMVDFTQIRIVDISGKTVFQDIMTCQNAVIPNFNSGIYFVTFQNDLVSKTMKILVD